MFKSAARLLLLAALIPAACVAPSPKSVSTLAIATTALPSGTVGAAYSQQIQVTGGTAPYSYSATGLPLALSISTSGGLIAGTPAQSAIGTASVVVVVTDSSSPQKTATTTLPLTVTPATLTITTTALANAIAGSPYTAVLGAAGGTPPYTYAAAGLPSTLAINTATGAITGTPTVADIGAHAVTFTVTDAAASKQTATATLTLTVLPSGLSIATTALPTGVVNWPYAAAIAATGGTPPYTFAAANLPTPLVFDPATGAISGTPSTAGTTTVTFTVTDSGSPTAQQVSTQLPLTIDGSSSAAACKNASLGDNASLNGFTPFPADNAWNTDVSSAAVDPNSASITAAAEFAGHFLHPDFSSVNGGNYGIPYTVVDNLTPLTPISVTDYAAQSDVALAPFPTAAPIEGSPADCTGWPNTYVGDAHVLVLDRNFCMLYETFNTHRCLGQWSASQETIWNLLTDEQRPWTWTSADAAGLSILAGLVRYDEVASGAIHHAIRFTMPSTLRDSSGSYFVPPATHGAGNSTTTLNVMGMRIRLKAGFDISSFSPANQVILTAMKKYGLILADNGSAFYFQGAPDSRWDDNDLSQLKTVSSDNFEVVQMTPAYPGYNDSAPPAGSAPTISSFTATATTITAGQLVTFNWTTTGSSYVYIDQLGGQPGNSAVAKPTATTTYTLYATNQYGRTQQSITITVN